MTEQTSQEMFIDAAPAQCFAVAIDFADYPDWASDVKAATVLSLDDDGRGGTVSYRAAAMGRSTSYTLRYFYGTNPLRFSWKLVESDLLRQLDGEYEFMAIDGEPERTRVTYHLAVEIAMPLPGFVKRRAEARIIRTALDDLRRRVEAAVTS
jgi:ribosome-associated toxin RatA of RatAB toxin-antitoxin module